MGLSINQFIVLVWREVYRRRIAVVAAFCIISIAMLATGVFLPKVYSSHAIIHADQTNIIRPLMEGTAVTTGVKDQAQNARELLLRRRIMEQVLREAGMDLSGLSELEIERLLDKVKTRTEITAPGKSLIRIEYRDPSPEQAFRVAQKYAELLVTESAREKKKESREAFNFVDQQVREYHKKLIDSEEKLEEFRSNNIEGTQGDSFKRISSLRRQLEAARLELSEEKVKERSLERQLSGEASATRDMAKDGTYGARIAELQMRLDQLRLQFHDSYPDIVKIKNQLSELRAARENARSERKEKIEEAKEKGETYVDDSIAGSPLYQELKSKLSETRTRIAALEARIEETRDLLDEESDRIKRINESDARLSELTRDYEVNRELYQDLLRRRERARVSMSLDVQERGLTMTIQEPARLSKKPYGVRFLHIALLGMPFAFFLPVGFIAGLLQVDRRVRSSEQIAANLGIPVAGEINELRTRSQEDLERRQLFWIKASVVGVVILYLVVGTLKWLQVVL